MTHNNSAVAKENLVILRKTLVFTKDASWQYGLAMLLTSLDGLVYTYVIAFSFERLLDGAQMGNMRDSLRFIGAVVPLSAFVFGFCASYLMAHVQTRFVVNIRQALVNRIMLTSKQNLDMFPTGDLLSRFTSDIDKAKMLVTRGLSTKLISPFVESVGSLILIWLVHPWLAIAGVLVGIISFLLHAIFLLPTHEVATSIQEGRGQLSDVVLRFLNGMPVVRMYQFEPNYQRIFTDANRRIEEQQLRQVHISTGQAILGKTMGYIEDLILVGIGTYLVSRGEIALGAFFASMRYAAVITGAFNTIGKGWTDLHGLAATAKRLINVLELGDEDKDKPHLIHATPIPADNSEPLLQIQHLSFSHRETKILDDINLKLYPGETIAIVGESGSGKTTLLQLILRLYTEFSGTIEFYGQDIREYDTKTLRKAIAYVPQSAYLFYGSILENIALGREYPERVFQAAQKAQIHEYIVSLPQGYKTSVGEKGASLSGGQRQRVAIARALMMNSPVVLLDEPAAFLDVNTEKGLYESIMNVAPRPAMIIVMHRFLIAKEVDRIYVLRQGRIVEQGTHDELIDLAGEYHRLYQKQLGVGVDGRIMNIS